MFKENPIMMNVDVTLGLVLMIFLGLLVFGLVLTFVLERFFPMGKDNCRHWYHDKNHYYQE